MEGSEDILESEFIPFSVLYSSITLLFACGVLAKFFCDELRFGFRALLTLVLLFLGEPICHFVIRGPEGISIYSLSCFLVYVFLPASHHKITNQVVVISGPYCALLCAVLDQLERRGVTLYVCLPPSQRDEAHALQLRYNQRVKVLQADISQSEQADFVQHQLSQDLAQHGLWGLVLLPPSGGESSALTSLPAGGLGAALTRGLVGPYQLARALTPLLAQARGRLVILNTTAGWVPVVSERHVAAVVSSGVEQCCHALRRELRPLGVTTCLVLMPDDGTVTELGPLPAAQPLAEAVTPPLRTAAVRAVRSALFSCRPRIRASCFARDDFPLWLWALAPLQIVDWIASGPYRGNARS